MRFDGRSVIVTGAASGIGRAIAFAFAKEGAAVAVVDRDARLGELVVEKMKAAGSGAVFISADLSVDGAASAMVNDAVCQLGRLDVLVNNAAILGAGRLDTVTEEGWDVVLATNLRAVASASSTAVGVMRQQGGGNIVNIASVAGIVGESGLPAYSASKGAVIALTKAMALDHAVDNVRVNCVCPGSTRTSLTDALLTTVENPDSVMDSLKASLPYGRQGRPREIAAGALFLASNDASYVSGSTLVIDGGLTLGFRPSSTRIISGKFADDDVSQLKGDLSE